MSLRAFVATLHGTCARDKRAPHCVRCRAGEQSPVCWSKLIEELLPLNWRLLRLTCTPGTHTCPGVWCQGVQVSARNDMYFKKVGAVQLLPHLTNA